MSGEHIRNEYGSSRCTRKEARLLAILTSRVTVWGIDYVAESPVKELSYVPVLDVSLIPSVMPNPAPGDRLRLALVACLSCVAGIAFVLLYCFPNACWLP
ncbi:hypothetical protein L1987_89104 [Smallanthus sonchifolius]|nr:hypothetical protein L1987_89831 [Smallanthus sonchifolius]KAI3666399.1 hypothetical protein L1987_89104 [Smallanthus sonchifolius]